MVRPHGVGRKQRLVPSIDPSPIYTLHGLKVRSSFELAAPTFDSIEPDLDVREGARFPVPSEPPKGTVLAGVDDTYTFTDAGSEYHLRFHGLCEFRVAKHGGSAVVDMDPTCDRDMISVLLGGSVCAFLLGLAGECVLHASAVEMNGGAIAFVGDSGMGKSTLAAILCGSGAQLLSDDVLRVAFDHDEVALCHPGTTEIRLREKASALLEDQPPFPSRATADDRLAVSYPPSKERAPILAAMAIPHPNRDLDRVRLERLSAAAGLAALLGYPRTLGWRPDSILRSRLLTLARLAEAVPMFEAHVPWGPPFPANLGAQILEALSSARSRHVRSA